MRHLRPASFLFILALCAPLSAVAGPKQSSGRGFTGENPIGVPRDMFLFAQEGLELMYQRRYADALAAFEEAGVAYPDSPLGPIGRAVVYEAQMFENYDFSKERVYYQEIAEAKERMEIVIGRGELQAWNHFMRAALLGIDAMHDTRKSEYLTAFNKAWDALDSMKRVERIAPQWKDVQLALGLYNYWRTVITEEVDYLPSFGDKRQEGLRQMQLAKDEGLLARAPASLALTWTYLEQNDHQKALAEGLWARSQYPNSIINEMTLSRVFRAADRFDDGIDALDRVNRIDPQNKRVWFQYGEAYYKARKDNTRARQMYQKYLATNPMPEYASHAWYRLGLLSKRERKYDDAIGFLEKAVAAYPKWKAAGERLAELRALRDGKTKTVKYRGARESVR